MATTVTDVAQQILAQVKAQLGTAWADSLLEADRQLLTAIAADAAQLQIDALALGLGDPSGLLAEKAQINAQLANIASISAAEVNAAFWVSVQTVAAAALKIAVAVA